MCYYIGYSSSPVYKLLLKQNKVLKMVLNIFSTKVQAELYYYLSIWALFADYAADPQSSF